LKLSYSGDLKTRNNQSLGSLGTPYNNVQVGDMSLWRTGRVSNVDLLRSLNRRELR
jgi:hypothetical protein